MTGGAPRLIRDHVREVVVPSGDLPAVAARAVRRTRRRRAGTAAAIVAVLALTSVAIDRLMLPTPPVVDQAPDSARSAPGSQPGPAGTLTPVYAAPSAVPTRQWSAPVDGRVAAVEDTGGRLLVAVDATGDEDVPDTVEARDPSTGAQEWRVPVLPIRSDTTLMRAVEVEGTLVLTVINASFDQLEEYGLDPATGAVRWTIETRNSTSTPPVAIGDGLLAVANTAEEWARVYDAATGETAWEVDAASAAVAPGTVAVVRGEELQVFDAHGTKQWTARIDASTRVPITIDDGLVVTGEGDTVVARDLADGAPRWRTTPDIGAVTGLAPVRDGGFYATHLDTTDSAVAVLGPEGRRVARHGPVDRNLWQSVQTDAGIHVVDLVDHTLPNGDETQALVVTDVLTGARTPTLPPPSRSRGGFGGPSFDIVSGVIGANSRLVANGALVADETELRLHDLQGLEPQWSIQTDEAIWGMRATPDGLVVVTEPGPVRHVLSLWRE